MKIREAVKADVPRMMELIIELATFENGLDKVTNTAEKMEKDGFGPNPLFKALVAEEEGQIQGLCLYYYRYSTWRGKQLYLEDLIITEQYRGEGMGKALFEEVLAIAKSTECTGMFWQVLDWNEDAIKFYKGYGAHFDDDWVNCILDF